MNNNYEFTYSDYIHIHDLVFDYQSGSESAKVELINIFAGFISAYIELIKKGQYNIDNYSLRQFMGSFLSHPQARKHINQYQYKPYVKREIENTIPLITGLFSRYEESDIQHDLTIVLFTLCNRYKDTNPSFHTYMQKCFHYQVLAYYKPLLKNANVHNLYNQVQLEEMEDHLEDNNQRILLDKSLLKCDKEMCVKYAEGIKVKDTTSPYDDNHFNTNWIMGLTCSEEFKSLTNYERNILVESYIHNKSDQQIADRYGVCRATINRRKQSAKEKLYNMLKKNYMIK